MLMLKRLNESFDDFCRRTYLRITTSRNTGSLSVIKSTDTVQIDTVLDKANETLFLDFSKMPFSKVIIDGLKSIHFAESIAIGSNKHIEISSGWERSFNYFKVWVNSEMRPGEDVDTFAKRMANEPQYIRRYPKRPVKMRKQLVTSRFRGCNHKH